MKTLYDRKATLTASHDPEEEKKKQMYLLTFLIDDTVNTRRWAASWDSIKKLAKTFHGMPGLAYTRCGYSGCKLDHPPALEGETFQQAAHKQKPYRVTTILDTILDEETHTAYAIHRVDDPDFAQRVRNGEIKFLSPGVYRTEGDLKKDQIRTKRTINGISGIWVETTDWKGLHDAFVSRGAYGDKATIVDSCEGAGKYCVRKLRRMFPANKTALPKAA